MTSCLGPFPRPNRPPTHLPWFVPHQAWYLNLLSTMIIGGILPFGAVFIELYFIMSSVWLQRFYYVFGFLAMVLFILLVGKRVESSRPDRECLQSPSRPHGHSLACVLYNLSGSSALSFR